MDFHWRNNTPSLSINYISSSFTQLIKDFILLLKLVSLEMQQHATAAAGFEQFGKWGVINGDNQEGDDGSYQLVGSSSSSASKNHSEAEKRRRDRINAHLATLRKLLMSNSSDHKMDKATLLGKVVEHLKQLKSETTELSKVFTTLPTDSDEVTIDFVANTTTVDERLSSESRNVCVKVSISCEDRPELLSEVNHTLKSLNRLTMVQADMSCLCGRIKCNFIFNCVVEENPNSGSELTTLKQSLKILFGRIVSSSSWTTSSSNYRIKSKRQRFFCSSDYNSMA